MNRLMFLGISLVLIALFSFSKSNQDKKENKIVNAKVKTIKHDFKLYHFK